MLQEVHQLYKTTLRESDWLVKAEILYLGLVPAILVGAFAYLTWLYFAR